MKKYARIIVLIILVAAVVVLAFISSRNKRAENPVVTTPSPTAIPTPLPPLFDGLNVGKSTDKDITTALGSPLRTLYYKNVATLIYPSSMSGRNISVEVYQDGSIKRVMEPLPETQRFSAVTKGFGKEDLLLYGKNEDLGFRLYVFTRYGVAFLANPSSDIVREKWYFPVTDPTTFQNALGEGFSTTHVEVKP